MERHNLNYVDSIGDVSPKGDEIEENYDEIISLLTSALAGLRWQCKDFELQIEKVRSNPFSHLVNTPELLEFETAIFGFYKNYIRLLFYMVDVMTAFKYMKLARMDWDYRFFVRRIYTLMYETSESKYDYMKSANETINAIRKYVDEETFNKVTECQCMLRKFLKGNNGVIEKVRSNNEAHKTYNVDELFATVEGLSVKDSLTLIEEYKRLLIDFFSTLCEVHFALERYNERARWVIMPSGFLAAGLL